MVLQKDLQVVKSEIGCFAERIPKEDTLKFLIEADIVEVLVIGKPSDNQEYGVLLDAVRLYLSCYDHNIRLRFMGNNSGYENLKRMILLQGLNDYVEFVDEDDKESQLAYYLGCDVALMLGEYDTENVELLKAKYFYLPVLTIGEDRNALSGENVLCIRPEVAEIAAAVRVLKNNSDYRKRLGKDSRKSYNRIIGQ